jgi:hypothetical protein
MQGLLYKRGGTMKSGFYYLKWGIVVLVIVFNLIGLALSGAVSNETQDVHPPEQEIVVDVPDRVNRGDRVLLRAEVNTSSGINLTWNLPEGFELINGNQTVYCETGSCLNEIEVEIGLSTTLGEQVINICGVEKTMTVYANTSIGLVLIDNYVQARLELDNGSAIRNQSIEFFIDNTSIGSLLTNSSGYAVIELNLSGVLKAVYSGSGYFNPSHSIKEIKPEEYTVLIEWSERVHSEIVIGLPVEWVQEISISNPGNQTIYNYTIDLDIPKDAFEVEVLVK